MKNSGFLPSVAFAILMALVGTPDGLAAPGVPYEVIIEGVSEKEVLDDLKASSDSFAMRDRPPATMGMLRQRAERDKERFLKLFKANGYYGAGIEVEIDSESKPVLISFKVHEGPPYLLGSVDFQVVEYGKDEDLELPGGKEIGLRLNEPLRSRAVLDAEKKLLHHMRRKGFPFPRVTERKVIVDHATRSVSVGFSLNPGPKAWFGKTTVIGLTSVNESLVRGEIPWQEGDLFNADRLDEFRNILMGLGLFASVRVITDESPDEKGWLPVTAVVTERKHRSIGAGLGYRTDERLLARLTWEHRNIFHGAERLSLAAKVSGFTKSAEAGFKKPYFLREDQTLRLSFRMAEDEPDAYMSRNLTTSGVLERNLTREIKAGAGLAFKLSEVEQLEEEEKFRLLYLPSYLEWDSSDRLLDPTSGGRLTLLVAPYLDMRNVEFGFLKTQMSATRYVPVSRTPGVILAGRLGLGSLSGTDLFSVPADERFYAGGGGSIRGYSYQSVGPLVEGQPTGGRSLLEVSLELRLELTSRWGLVGFLDGGNVYERTAPDFSEPLLWGTGVGFRYFTPVGPLRFDVAVPLDRRPEIDDHFQIYVSLGQAF